MNNNVSVEETELIANKLKEIATSLKHDYTSISTTISKINDNISTLKSWNGQDAIKEPYPSDIKFFLIIYTIANNFINMYGILLLQEILIYLQLYLVLYLDK